MTRKTRAAAPEPDYALNVVLLYQSRQSRSWAEEVCARVERVAGKPSVRSSAFDLHQLHQPELLADAIAKARRSDVIIIAVRAAEELPLAFFVWADVWLSGGLHPSGALVALIDLPERPLAQMDQTRQYLMALARRSKWDFLVQERKLPAEHPGFAPELLKIPSPPGALAARGAPQEEYHSIPQRWGINE